MYTILYIRWIWLQESLKLIQESRNQANRGIIQVADPPVSKHNGY